MTLLKRTLLAILLLAVAAYLVVAVTAFSRKPKGNVCQDVEVYITDSITTGFITKQEVLNMLGTKRANPVGKVLDSINTQTLEDIMATHPLIKRVDCYKSPSGKVCFDIVQRQPVLRVMSNSGEDYYLDDEGNIMPASTRNATRLAVVTGNVNKSFAQNELYKFGIYLQKDEFWNKEIEQIHVLRGNNLEFVPLVGDHIVYMGKLDNYEQKLERLKKFYTKALNEVGWNKYSRINIEFTNQIICTKR